MHELLANVVTFSLHTLGNDFFKGVVEFSFFWVSDVYSRDCGAYLRREARRRTHPIPTKSD